MRVIFAIVDCQNHPKKVSALNSPFEVAGRRRNFAASKNFEITQNEMMKYGMKYLANFCELLSLIILSFSAVWFVNYFCKGSEKM